MGVKSTEQPREGAGRRVAMLTAALLTMGAIGLAAWSIISTRSPALTETPAPPPESKLFPDSVATTAATNEPTPIPPVEELLDGQVGASEHGRIELVDPSGRVVRELLYERLEPREGGRVEVTRPQAWIHLSSGDLAHLQSQRGSLVQPPGRREPESGRFEGDVRVHLYSADPRQSNEELSPSLVFSTESLSFDTAMGELRTNDPVTITSAGLLVEFTGFTLLIDDVNQRLALFRTDSAGKATIDPTQFATGSRGGSSSSSGADGSTGGATLIEKLYHAAMTGDVRIASGTLSAAAERLDLWTRLLDDKPTPATQEGLRLLAESVRSTPGEGRTSGTNENGASGEATAPSVITLSWSTGLVIEPLDRPSTELDEDDAFVRLASPMRGAVRILDERTGVNTSSVSLDYAAATRRVVWSGLGPRGVVLQAPDAFEANCGRFEVELASGDASFPGPGVIRSLRRDIAADPDRPESPQQITWSEHADLSLARNANGVDFSGKPLLTKALFVGDARASDGGVSISGSQLQSYFALDRAGSMALSRAIVTGGTRVDAGPDGLMTAQRLDIEFDLTDAQGPAPSVATAQGDVRGSRAGSTLRADLAEARFRRSVTGRFNIDSFSADLGVVVRTADGVEATADSLRAVPETGVVDLRGEPARISLGASAVTGDSMRIEELARRLKVYGPGALTRNERDDGLGYENLRLEWADSMVYDDFAGDAQFLGECVLTADVSELARDVVTAARMNIKTQPFKVRQAGGAADQPILSAAAYGASGENGGDKNLARVESRRYVKDVLADSGLRLTRLVYLDGATILADAVHNELHVPSAGRLLIENRRLSETTPGGPASDIRGTALVEWDGSFDLRRDAGAAEFRRQVRVRHRPIGAMRVTELESERLELAFDPDAVGGASESANDLLWAQAQGAVYVAQGQRQVIADRLLYDGSLGFAELTAWPGNVVTLFDTSVPTPLAGDLLRWDLLRDRVEWRGARATAAPD